MKKVRKFLPLSIYDIPGVERWLEQQANAGLFPVFLDAWVTFTPNGVPGTRFRLEPWGKSGSAPTAEQLELYREAGWDYALTVGSAYFLFYATDPEAVDLYSDPQSRGLSLERLEMRVRRARRTCRILWGALAAVLVAVLLFHTSSFDVQPDRFARLPLVLLELFQPTPLLLAAAAVFSLGRHRRDTRMLEATCRALKNGLPPPTSPGPSKGIVRENAATVVLLIPLALLVLGSWLPWLNPLHDIPLEDVHRPYVALADLESEPVGPWEAVMDGLPFRERVENVGSVHPSLLSPTWYTVSQRAYSFNGTEQNVFAPWHEAGHRYAPFLDMTCFSLLPPLARPVALAQMDEFRLVNLLWSYEEVSVPGLDFVILAQDDDGIWQMAALGRGGHVAVFRYAGAEQLADHLEQLSAMVQ